MKHLKIGLVIAAMAAMMATIGAGSASATTALCAHEEAVCAAPLASGTVFKGATGATPENALLSTNLANFECMSSVEGHTNEATGATALNGEVTALNWSECHIAGAPTQTCTVASVHLPYAANINRTGEGTGTFTATTGTGGKPGVTFLCGPLISCEFLKENASLEAQGGVAGTAFAKANAISLTIGSGSKCPTKATWTAKYFLSSPSAAFISQ
jgi:hypothetical protein